MTMTAKNCISIAVEDYNELGRKLRDLTEDSKELAKKRERIRILNQFTDQKEICHLKTDDGYTQEQPRTLASFDMTPKHVYSNTFSSVRPVDILFDTEDGSITVADPYRQHKTGENFIIIHKTKVCKNKDNSLPDAFVNGRTFVYDTERFHIVYDNKSTNDVRLRIEDENKQSKGKGATYWNALKNFWTTFNNTLVFYCYCYEKTKHYILRFFYDDKDTDLELEVREFENCKILVKRQKASNALFTMQDSSVDGLSKKTVHECIGKTICISDTQFFIYDCDNITKGYLYHNHNVTEFPLVKEDMNPRKMRLPNVTDAQVKDGSPLRFEALMEEYTEKHNAIGMEKVLKDLEKLSEKKFKTTYKVMWRCKDETSKQISTKLQTRLKKEFTKCNLEFVTEFVTDETFDIPWLVFCMNATRLGEDIKAALQDLPSRDTTEITEKAHVAVIVVHYKTKSALPSTESSKLVVKKEYGIDEIFDVAYQPDDQFYNCDMNKKYITEICKYINGDVGTYTSEDA